MSTRTFDRSKTHSLTKLAILGAIAGIGGGIIFGVMMAMMNFLPMVAMLVGSESALIGFLVHLAISAFAGGLYGVVIGQFSNTARVALVGGVVNGLAWWVVGALTLMPLLLGMGQMVFVIGSDQWMSLIGHLVYGLVTAFLLVALRNRA